MSAAAFTDTLVRAVLADVDADLLRYGRCRSWTDLHDVCDANEFLIDVWAKVGQTCPDWAAEHVECDAIERVNDEVFSSARVLRRTFRLLGQHIRNGFTDVVDHAGCLTIASGDGNYVLVDTDDGKIRVGVYRIVGRDDMMSELSDVPHIWVEFDHVATLDQIVSVVDTLVVMP